MATRKKEDTAVRLQKAVDACLKQCRTVTQFGFVSAHVLWGLGHYKKGKHDASRCPMCRQAAKAAKAGK